MFSNKNGKNLKFQKWPDTQNMFYLTKYLFVDYFITKLLYNLK